MSDGLGFLISDVSRLMRKRFDERARTFGATRAQWKTLFTLSRNEGLNQGALADRLDVEPITLCRMIDRLEESGLVERRRDPGDRRAWNIYLTDAAQPVIANLRTHADAMADDLVDGLSDQEKTILISALTRIHANLSHPDANEAAHG